MPRPVSFTLNGKPVRLDTDEKRSLLWALRTDLGLTGTKYGCGIAECGACTVHVEGEATRACVTRMQDVAGKAVVTIEGLSRDGTHPVQRAWLQQQVPQCGYCQSGQIMQAAAFLASTRAPTDAQIDEAMAGNLCRCGTYPRIRQAVKSAAAKLKGA